MIIDSHTHLPASDNRAVEKLLKSMDTAGIDRAVVFGSWGNFYENDEMIKRISPHSKRLFAVGKASPLQASDKKVLKDLQSGVLRGIKFYLGYEYFYANDRRLYKYCRVAEKCGAPVIFHTGDTYSAIAKAKIKYAHPLPIDDLAVDFPNLNIIIAHFGNPWLTDAMAVVYKNKNVYADISGWVYEKFNVDSKERMGKLLLDARGYLGDLNKIIFGTDYPIAEQKDYVEFVNHLPVTKEEKENIFSRNAIKLFRM